MTKATRNYRFPVSVGICVYNEEKNIAWLLRSLLVQKTDMVNIREIIIISSGSTDKTDTIISDFIKKFDHIKLIIQEKREGKASALNLFFKNASQQILVVVNGDTILQEDSIEKLVLPLNNPEVGMTGGHPIPVNDEKCFIGFTIHLLWNLHHLISLSTPKLGEFIAVRNVVRIPHDTAADEAWIESIIKSKGFTVAYASDAIVYNRGPNTVSDYLKQRRRIFAGHLHIKSKTGYKLSTMNSFITLFLILKSLRLDYRIMIFTFGAILLEFLGRTLGFYDLYIRRKNPYVWDAIKTTKEIRE